MTATVVAIPAGEYHADPCVRPSLSASIAHTLCVSSPRHAWTHHPRLNPDWRRDDDPTFDIGTAAHAVILEGRDVVVVVDAKDWRTADARDQRDQARAAGRIPLLLSEHARVQEMADAIAAQLADHNARPVPFTAGEPEQTVTWLEDDGVECRALIDWLHNNRLVIDDLKTTSRSAHPDAYARRIYDTGGDIQAWWYTRAVEALTGTRPEFRWVVVETHPPYALSVVVPSPAVLTIGMKKALYARSVWARCLEADEWPAYPADVATAELPAWEESRWLERELREEVAA